MTGVFSMNYLTKGKKCLIEDRVRFSKIRRLVLIWSSFR